MIAQKKEKNNEKSQFVRQKTKNAGDDPTFEAYLVCGCTAPHLFQRSKGLLAPCKQQGKAFRKIAGVSLIQFDGTGKYVMVNSVQQGQKFCFCSDEPTVCQGI